MCVGSGFLFRVSKRIYKEKLIVPFIHQIVIENYYRSGPVMDAKDAKMNEINFYFVGFIIL
jgi:hypothetical protein